MAWFDHVAESKGPSIRVLNMQGFEAQNIQANANKDRFLNGLCSDGTPNGRTSAVRLSCFRHRLSAHLPLQDTKAVFSMLGELLDKAYDDAVKDGCLLFPDNASQKMLNEGLAKERLSRVSGTLQEQIEAYRMQLIQQRRIKVRQDFMKTKSRQQYSIYLPSRRLLWVFYRQSFYKLWPAPDESSSDIVVESETNHNNEV